MLHIRKKTLIILSGLSLMILGAGNLISAENDRDGNAIEDVKSSSIELTQEQGLAKESVPATGEKSFYDDVSTEMREFVLSYIAIIAFYSQADQGGFI